MSGLLAAVALSACLQAPVDLPAVSIIIDDLGNRPRDDYAALETPDLLTYAILPFSPLTKQLANSANAAGKEILVHVPMEAHSRNHLLGPGALRVSMAYDEFVGAVRDAVADVPHAIGINNHMGSLLTQDFDRMRWLMGELKKHSALIYIDSRTTSKSVAARAAREASVPYVARDVFLDNQRESTYIHARLNELVAQARVRGDAIAIAHPHPETLQVLRDRLPGLKRVRLVPIATLLKLRECRVAQARLERSSISPAAQSEQGEGYAGATDYPDADR